MYDAGQLWESVVLKQLSTTADTYGGLTNSYTTLGTYRAKVERKGASQKDFNSNITKGQEIDIIVRFKEFTLTNNDDYMITWDSRNWIVRAWEQEGTRGNYLRISCYNEA